MPVGRLMPDTVILPDGTILYTNGVDSGRGGGNTGEPDGFEGATKMTPVLSNHLFDPRKPVGSRWSTVADSAVPRLYHSGAILVADGRVITMGSEMANVCF